MADMKIHNDVVIGRDVGDERKHGLRRCGEFIVFGIHSKDVNTLALLVIFRRKITASIGGR